MSLKIGSYGRGGYTGGEWRSKERFGYGLFQVNMKPIKNPGVVSSFFTYTGPSDGTKWDEIDIEFLGKNTTKVQFNYYTSGQGNHEYLDNLGFDASQGSPLMDLIGKLITLLGMLMKELFTLLITIFLAIMMNAWSGTNEVDTWLGDYNKITL